MMFLIAVVSGFGSGVFFRSLFSFGFPVIVFIGILAAICIAAFFVCNRRAIYVLGTLLFISAVFGIVRVSIVEAPLPASFAGEVKHRVSYEGKVISGPDIRDADQRIQVRVQRGKEVANILAVVPRMTKVSAGDIVRVSGTLSLPEPFATDGGRMFRYDKYLERDGVRFILNFGSITVVREAPWYSVPATFANIKYAFLEGLRKSLPDPYAALAGGLIIGGKTGLGNELRESFVRSGLIQIVVLSGYNIMIIAEWVMAGLAFFKMPHRLRPIAGALAIALFICIAGASATALRAALMAFIALYARASGRTYTAGRALLLVVFLMLLWNPLSLVFDPGFGLSVAATAGIIWLSPVIETFLRIKNPFWRNTVSVTLAAQITVLPLLLYETGNLSLASIPANMLVMPMVPLAMGFSVIAGFSGMLFGAVFPAVSFFLSLPAYLANAYLIIIAKTSSALPFSAFTISAFPFWIVLLSYIIIIYLHYNRSNVMRSFRTHLPVGVSGTLARKL